jgi:hypothetical protein
MATIPFVSPILILGVESWCRFPPSERRRTSPLKQNEKTRKLVAASPENLYPSRQIHHNVRLPPLKPSFHCSHIGLYWRAPRQYSARYYSGTRTVRKLIAVRMLSGWRAGSCFSRYLNFSALYQKTRFSTVFLFILSNSTSSVFSLISSLNVQVHVPCGECWRSRVTKKKPSAYSWTRPSRYKAKKKRKRQKQNKTMKETQETEATAVKIETKKYDK